MISERISIEYDQQTGCMELMEKEQVEVEEKAIRYIAKKADGSMRDALSLLDQCIAFYLGQKLTYDHVLDVLGAVDTEVFSRFLREILSNERGSGHEAAGGTCDAGSGAGPVCLGFHLVSSKSSPFEILRRAGRRAGRVQRQSGCF